MKRNLSTPFYVEVEMSVCRCSGPVAELGRFKRYERAVAHADGYWNVFLAFFGHMANTIRFSIVDARTGEMLWRNGRHLKREGIDAA